ncbi:carboxymuconolactone decarboxylase family protein [Providencia vermicola]|uniref:Carboxymuconolactone decarboxylase family protein n=5 Tax=Providencia TaxID=586 RepID=A0AAI9DAN8_PROST|nr:MULTISPECIES: carboxymuconolactone decarboxylase family protein [Providencia]MDV5228168.1 carboxymuconolactone decarboxylase family protein [Providencia rettgeri]SPY79042.1 alkylhydroperoxidase AhpD family core domain [Providencia rustigianii]ELR5112279.1 carboxymuconolactone decarboxylase family protein [Providencia stuartii]MCX3072571.1 carboxymuconolactone decarboxylase family protein [Providencia stuartii]MDT1067768.1 carboxymuconolactone decarboxylase family protein [Providencia stuart
MTKFQTITHNISTNLADLGQHIPDVMKNFSGLVSSGTKDGALDTKTKELIAIGIAVANRCDGCIGFHTKKLIDLGVTEQELAEALGVAIFMGGGPSAMYAAETMGAFKEFNSKTE